MESPGNHSNADLVRVLYVDHTPIMGGAQLSLLELAETLGRSSFEVAVACTDRCPKILEALDRMGVRRFTVRLPRLRGNILSVPLRYGSSVSDLVRACRRFQPHIVHSNSARTHIYGISAAKLTGARAVWTLRDMEFPRRLFRYVGGQANAVICVSQAVRDHYPGAERHPRLSVIPNGIVVRPVDRDDERRRVRSELGLPQDVPVVGSVGRMLPWKGQDAFLRAAALVRESVPNARFVLLGNPDSPQYLSSLESLARDLHISDRTIFGGFREDILASICGFDVLVHTSKEPEPFGRVIIEAMAVGTPVIASPMGGPLEIINHGVNGLLVHPDRTREIANSIVRIVSDPGFAQGLSDRARCSFTKSYDQTVETHAVQSVYHSVLRADC